LKMPNLDCFLVIFKKIFYIFFTYGMKKGLIPSVIIEFDLTHSSKPEKERCLIRLLIVEKIKSIGYLLLIKLILNIPDFLCRNVGE